MKGRLNSYERSLLAGVALVIAVALLLSGDDPPDPPEGGGAEGKGASQRAAVRLSAREVRRIAGRVERLRQLRFARPVRPVFVDRERAAELLRNSTRAEYPIEQQRIDEESLKLLGLMKPSESLGEALAAVEQEEVLGFYDQRARRLVVIRDEVGSRALLEITLAHELVHALEDQRFDFHARGGLSDDAALGEAGLAEGTATEVMTEYAERYLEGGELLDVALGAVGGTSADLPAYVEKALLFPYEKGQKFVAAFRARNRGWRAVNQVFRLRRPRSSEQILHPERYAVDDRPRRVGTKPLTRVLGRDWRRLGVSSVGELDLAALFELVGGSASPHVAAGWGGGRFELWRRRLPSKARCPAPCIARDVGILRVAWDSGSDRREAERNFPQVFEKGLDGKGVGPRRGPRLWQSRGGAIGIVGDDRTTTIVLAPTIGLAARLLARGVS